MDRAGDAPSPSTLNSVMATRAAITPPWADGGATGVDGRVAAGTGTSNGTGAGVSVGGAVAVGNGTVGGGGTAGCALAAASSGAAFGCAKAAALAETAIAKTATWARVMSLQSTITTIVAQSGPVYSVFSRRFFIRLRRASKDSLVMILLNSAR